MHKKVLLAVVCYCLIILIINYCSFANQGLILNTFCNVQQKSLYQFLKISFKFKKCAISNKSIQNGRPSRSPKKDKKRAKKSPRTPKKTLEIPEDSARDPRRTENCHKNAVLCHLSQKMTQKKEVSFRRLPKEP